MSSAPIPGTCQAALPGHGGLEYALIEVVTERVLATIARYRMFEPGQCVGVAVSGGADSVALLHLLLELAPRLGISVSILHLDHMLRGEESRADAEFVRNLGLKLGIFAH